MNSLDLIAAALIGIFLLATAWHGNTAQLFSNAARDIGFLKWAIAVGVLFYLYSVPGLAGPLTLIILMVFVALGINAGPQIITGASTLWKNI